MEAHLGALASRSMLKLGALAVSLDAAREEGTSVSSSLSAHLIGTPGSEALFMGVSARLSSLSVLPWKHSQLLSRPWLVVWL